MASETLALLGASLIVGVPAFIAAVNSRASARKLRTSNGAQVGELVEQQGQTILQLTTHQAAANLAMTAHIEADRLAFAEINERLTAQDEQAAAIRADLVLQREIEAGGIAVVAEALEDERAAVRPSKRPGR